MNPLPKEKAMEEIPLIKLGQGRDEPCRWADDPAPVSPELARIKRKSLIAGVLCALVGVGIFGALVAAAGITNACFFAAFCLGFVLAMVLLSGWCE